MRTFEKSDDRVSRYVAQLESALLARALADAGGVSAERAKALLGLWLVGTFNGSVVAMSTLESGPLSWEPEAEGYRLVWYMPAGIACPLAHIYPQPDGSWAVLIVAGVRNEITEAMAAAEWGISRLISD